MRFAHASFAVLDSFFRAIANTGHAMRTIFTPDRFLLFQVNIIKRTLFYALSATDTRIICLKCVGFHKKFIENRSEKLWQFLQVILKQD